MASEIIRNIENLLHEHECVVVEGLGAFILQHECAIVHHNQTISAPQTKISFHASLRHDDGLLLNTLAKQRHTTYLAVRQLLMQEVQSLHSLLQSGVEVQMGRLGTMVMTDGKIVFTPRSTAWLADNLGAVTLDLPKARTQENSNSGNHDYITVRFRRERVRYAAACVLGLALLSIAPRSQMVTSEQYASISPLSYTNILTASATLQQTDTEILTPITAVVEEEEQTVTAEPIRPKNCHVVVASLDAKAAQKYCQKLHKQGFENATIKRYKKTSRVIIDSYETRNEALAAMETLRQNESYKRAWVWIEK